jgi:succinyl-CoA synthetase beta subunit
MDIEEIAEKSPDAIRRAAIDPVLGLMPYQTRYLTGHFPEAARKGSASILQQLYRVLANEDATLVEINPLALLDDGSVVALDSKVTIDNNALFRHEQIAALANPADEDPQEAMAKEKGLTYVKLDGNVGVLANGAGLGMSTVDVVAHAGGRPANFCDLGGGGSAQGVIDALEVITADPQVRSILFNIFGGITRGDEVARGILQALEQLTIEQPIVVRLDGTNAEEGRRILEGAAPPNLHPEATMLDAAKRAVELAA